MDKLIKLQEALYDFGNPPNLIKMHPKDWFELYGEFVQMGTSISSESLLLGIPVEVDPNIPQNEFVIE